MKNVFHLSMLLMMVACGVQDSSGQKDGIADGDHRIFATMTVFDGNLGGLEGADAHCSSAAAKAGLTRDYNAILSTDTRSAESRLNITGTVYMFTDESTRVLVAASGIDFWNTNSQSLRSAITKSEIYTNVTSKVWTGTTLEGDVMPSQNCNEWQSSSSTQSSFYGTSTSINSEWIEDRFESCNNVNHLYCISVD